MFPLINENTTNGIVSNSSNLTGKMSSFSKFNNNNNSYSYHSNGTNLSEEEQQFYNHHIIENFIESVREMNNVVLIPSKLKDLDPTIPSSNATTANTMPTFLNGIQINSNNSNASKFSLNDDLYSYYKMINIVKNDLFESQADLDQNKKIFLMPKRKLSRQFRHQNSVNSTSNGLNTRSVSTSSLYSLMMNGCNQTNERHSPSLDLNQPMASENGISNDDSMIIADDNTNNNNTDHDTTIMSKTASIQSCNGNVASTNFAPLSSEQLIGQNAKQLTIQFIHHLHSLYTILEHFTQAADFITERYTNEFEQSII